MGRAVFLLLLVPLANAAGSQSFFVSRVNEATGICVSKDSFMSAPITDPNSLEKSAKKLSYNSWVKNWTTTNMTEEATSWFAPYEWEFLPQVTSKGSYEKLTSVNAMGAFFLSILAKDAADVLLTSSMNEKILLRIKRSQTAALELYHCADETSDSQCNLAQQDELGLVSMSRKGIHQWEHLGFELHQNSLTVSRIQNFALKQRWSGINFNGVGQMQVSGRASPAGLFKPHQGTKLKVESGGAQLQGSFRVLEASSVEFRMRNRLPTRFKQPTLSVEGGGQVQVLNVTAGGRARFPLVNLKAGNSKIIINQWTEGADVKVIYINKILKIYPNDGSVAVGCQFFSHSASDDLEETFADASNRCSHTVSLSANEKEQICKALHLTTTNGADCSKIRYCSAAPIDGSVGSNDIGNPLSSSSDRFLGRVFPSEFVVGVSVTMTVLCVLSVVLSVLVAVQVKRMVVHEQPHPTTNKDYTNETKVDDNDVYEEIGMKNMYQNF